MAKSLKQVQREIDANDPPIEVNQVWVARDSRGRIIRRLRIIAQHPEPVPYQEKGRAWIVVDLPSKMILDRYYRFTPEFNLRYVFRLHGEYKND